MIVFYIESTLRSIKKELLTFLQQNIGWKLTESTDWSNFYFHLFFLHVSEFNYLEEIKGYTVSNHGRAVLVDQRNFTYLLVRKVGKKVNWRCRKHRKLCKARATTRDNFIMNFFADHNHDPDEVPEILKNENKISCWICYFICDFRNSSWMNSRVA